MPLANYVPSVKKIPNSVGLSLSGGGFRATLFHLGALRRLSEFGILPKLNDGTPFLADLTNVFARSRRPGRPGGVADRRAAVPAFEPQPFAVKDMNQGFADGFEAAA